MARRKRKGSLPPSKDTRRRSQPTTNAERKQTTRSDLASEIQAERERIEMWGALIRRWVRQAVASVDKEVGIKLYLEEFEDGFKLSRSLPQDKEDEKLLEVSYGKDKDSKPQVKVLSQNTIIYTKERDLDGKPKPDTIEKPTTKPQK